MNGAALPPASLDQVCLPDRLPPLILMAFTRPELLQQVLDGIAQQTLLPDRIIAFVDGPRKPEDEPLINRCVTLLNTFSTTVHVKVIQRPLNMGCDRNVIAALTEVLAFEESLVYLEDDTVPNPYFYDRICRLLSAYRDQPQIFSVSAYASLPDELGDVSGQDFIVSNRVFALGLGLWADRWKAIDLAHRPDHDNPFGHFYRIPATVQTKLTLVNQFWLEKNNQTDWVITTTLAALHRGMRHIISTASLTRNIGFDHPDAKTYRGKEPAWINARYRADAKPSHLPTSLELLPPLQNRLAGPALVTHLRRQKGLWLSPAALWHFLKTYSDLASRVAFVRLFCSRLPELVRRWRRGKPI